MLEGVGTARPHSQSPTSRTNWGRAVPAPIIQGFMHTRWHAHKGLARSSTRASLSVKLLLADKMNPEDALQEQIRRYRQMTGEQRLKIALDLHRDLEDALRRSAHIISSARDAP